MFTVIVKPFCQVKEYDLIAQIKNADSAITLVYLNATWCHPCMEKLESIVSNFGNTPSIKFIVLFDRFGFENYKSRLFKHYDSSYFRLFPRKYYANPKGIISISVNGQKKMFKRFLDNYNQQLSNSITLNELWFGHAVILKNKTIYITKNLEKDKIISEIESEIKKN